MSTTLKWDYTNSRSLHTTQPADGLCQGDHIALYRRHTQSHTHRKQYNRKLRLNILSFLQIIKPLCGVRVRTTQTHSRWCVLFLISQMFAVIIDFSYNLYEMIELQSNMIGLNENLMRAR